MLEHIFHNIFRVGVICVMWRISHTHRNLERIQLISFVRTLWKTESRISRVGQFIRLVFLAVAVAVELLGSASPLRETRGRGFRQRRAGPGSLLDARSGRLQHRHLLHSKWDSFLWTVPNPHSSAVLIFKVMFLVGVNLTYLNLFNLTFLSPQL